jgi:hypothetical protein
MKEMMVWINVVQLLQNFIGFNLLNISKLESYWFQFFEKNGIKKPLILIISKTLKIPQVS